MGVEPSLPVSTNVVMQVATQFPCWNAAEAMSQLDVPIRLIPLATSTWAGKKHSAM